MGSPESAASRLPLATIVLTSFIIAVMVSLIATPSLSNDCSYPSTELQPTVAQPQIAPHARHLLKAAPKPAPAPAPAPAPKPAPKPAPATAPKATTKPATAGRTRRSSGSAVVVVAGGRSRSRRSKMKFDDDDYDDPDIILTQYTTTFDVNVPNNEVDVKIVMGCTPAHDKSHLNEVFKSLAEAHRQITNLKVTTGGKPMANTHEIKKGYYILEAIFPTPLLRGTTATVEISYTLKSALCKVKDKHDYKFYAPWSVNFKETEVQNTNFTLNIIAPPNTIDANSVVALSGAAAPRVTASKTGLSGSMSCHGLCSQPLGMQFQTVHGPPKVAECVDASQIGMYIGIGIGAFVLLICAGCVIARFLSNRSGGSQYSSLDQQEA